VSTWWPAQVNEDWAPRIEIRTGELREGLEIMMPVDSDLDGMGDGWEDLWELDSSRNDASEDPDEDGYLNLTEYLLDTNPQGKGVGCVGARPRSLSHLGMILTLIPLLCRRRR
jgi:hypothetical protein